MNVLDRRFARTLTKIAVWVVVFYYLWRIEFFTFLFVWLPWWITYIGGLFAEYGISRVMRFYAFWWYLAAFMSIILIFLIYETAYRIRREDFNVGGEFEGRVIWLRGVRQGLIYEAWDAYNYVMWKLGKKKEGPTKNSAGNLVCTPGTWPDPMSIPLGNRDQRYRTIYVRRHWPIVLKIPDRFMVPLSVKIKPTLFTVSIPNLDFERLPHPRVPGRWDYRVTDNRPKNQRTDTTMLTKKVRKALKRSGELVEHGISSDSETKKQDYTYGSFDIPQLRDREGSND